MADKEATVYIIDLGSSMGDCNNGRTESDLDWSMRYVWDKLCTTTAASRKTWQVGVVGVRTDVTDNPLDDAGEKGYNNISVLQNVAPMTLSALKLLQDKLVPSSTSDGDVVSAIVVAIAMIDEAAPQRLKYKRKIVLVTDGQGAIDGDDVGDIARRINELNIEITIIGVDFDDPEYPFKEEDKSQLKARNEKLLKSISTECKESVYGTMIEAVDELDTPRIKSTKPYKSFDGQLTLGDPETYKESALSIHVERYFKTKQARPITASNVMVKSETDATQSGQDFEGGDGAGGQFADLKTARNYKVLDPDAPGGKRDVPQDELARGYLYGRTAVPMPESEFNITKLETKKSFTIIGFIAWEKYERFLNMGESSVIFASKFNEKDELAFSALVNALYETESYGVARLVAKDGKEPQLLLLMPHIDTDIECLYDVPLPFAEDIRYYQFPPLDKVVTLGGQTLTKHRLLPSDELEEAMSDYVDAMDISAAGGDDEEAQEYAPIEDTYSPIIHRVNQAIRFRVVHPDKPLGLDSEVLTRYSVPPRKVTSHAKDQIERLIKVAEVKKVPPKAKGKRQREVVKPISGLDVDALLNNSSNGSSKAKRAKISAENSVPEFKQMLASADKVETIENATKQMGEVVTSFINTSMGDMNYDRAAENMRVMRDELVALEEPVFYNDFLKSLKTKIVSGELNGDRREMWWRIKFEKLGLITKKESEVSSVTEEEAVQFFKTS
ncbi:hypothetical protein MCOR27_006885 [Pyricularia oryzae]|uniref:ATP-dependent DNA helicase II subunit 2 n=2 Tax=Pyricularia TaxID=48558 RepID=A0ABQ8N357_PYRGI|nr:uncharacterized protein MGG_10157 [Pyricularia oryzae 70-15]KAH8837281.1 hypothetical protein MCOR01_010915 [Pyricularia oryzae]KAI6290475.1 hypothetical protein MCOR33_011275 [Pyricularia grisea]EHA53989.1 hypothetical protein MGG_10157 [Pyricularia oryzae 70-15]KAH9438049.1 hypothetical protein MCOR02_001690 [Pyricularia oryzae]KAI6255046.1 hypothetical protein MCOR19_008438 [Pyricularia oryzae]